MGTDIHCCIERLDRGAESKSHGVRRDRWRFVAPLEVKRNYTLFGILAGVRQMGITPIAAPRGLPADLDPASTSEIEDGFERYFGDYGYSWLTLAELHSYDWGKLVDDGYGSTDPARELCSEFYAWLQAQDGPGDELRIVFGFDS